MKKAWKRGALALATAMISGGTAQAQPAPQQAARPAPAALKAQADALLAESFPADGPGAAAIISRGGQVIYAGGRGLADVQGQRAITPDTVFRLGSITKQFSAAILLQLVQEGRLSLDDPLSKFFPDYPQPGASATVRQLLNHTSGIQSYTDIPGAMAEENISRARTTAEMIAWFRDLPAPTRPGEAWAYNNSAYVLVGAIIEKLTNMPWHQAVAERITKPLGLASIRYGVEEPSIAGMAQPYSRGEDGKLRPADRIHLSVPHAAGALTGNVRDLATWAQALHHGRILNAQSYATMLQPASLPEGKTHPYGLGLQLGDLLDHKVIGHGGGIPGFITASSYIPDEDLFIAVFANSDAPATSPELVLRKLAGAALGRPYPTFTRAEVNLASLEPLFGVYALPDGGERRFFARDGKLFTRRSGSGETEVFPAGDDRFFYGASSLSWFRMRRAADGRHVMDFYPNGESKIEAAIRTGPLPAEAAAVAVPRATLERYVGRYAMGPATLAVTLGADGVLSAQLSGQPALPLEAINAKEFRTRGVDARLEFREENGAVTSAVIHQGGQQIEGRRQP